jgi:hypothetical protein
VWAAQQVRLIPAPCIPTLTAYRFRRKLNEIKDPSPAKEMYHQTVDLFQAPRSLFSVCTNCIDSGFHVDTWTTAIGVSTIIHSRRRRIIKSVLPTSHSPHPPSSTHFVSESLPSPS